jgi:hypothetical protein
LKTLGTVTVSLVDSPLAEMTVTVGLDMVSCVGVAVVSIADLLSWWMSNFEIDGCVELT